MTIQLRCDLHVHTRYSSDCVSRVKDVLLAARRHGMDAVAITDHEAIDGALEALLLAPSGLIVVPGTEAFTTGGDLLALFVTEKIPSGLDPSEAVSLIHERGGLAVLPHPFDSRRRESMDPTAHGLEARIDGVEVLNAGCKDPEANPRALAFAQQTGLRCFGGSDAHTLSSIGRACTLVEVSERPTDATGLKRALLTGNLAAEGGRFDRAQRILEDTQKRVADRRSAVLRTTFRMVDLFLS